MNTLQGKRIVITGASIGIGRELARRCGAAGAQVALLSRASAGLEEATDAAGGSCFAAPADVREPASIKQAFAAISERFTAIDVLINNAGVILPGELEHQPEDEIVATISTNLTGAMLVTKAALGGLLAAPSGRIINIGSSAADHAVPLLSAYVASKAGLSAFSRSLAIELVDTNVSVSLITLGQVDSAPGSRWDRDLLTRAFAAWKRAGIFDNVWGRSTMTTEIVADTIIWALSQPPGHVVTNLDLRHR